MLAKELKQQYDGESQIVAPVSKIVGRRGRDTTVPKKVAKGSQAGGFEEIFERKKLFDEENNSDSGIGSSAGVRHD